MFFFPLPFFASSLCWCKLTNVRSTLILLYQVTIPARVSQALKASIVRMTLMNVLLNLVLMVEHVMTN